MSKEKLENWNDLSEEEKARLRASTPIAHDDPTAISTPAGWERWQRESAKKRAAMSRSEAGEGVFWLCVPKDSANGKCVFVEMYHGGDAARAAAKILGVPETVSEKAEKPTVDYYQVRWAGTAAKNPPDRRMQKRFVNANGNVGKWKDLT